MWNEELFWSKHDQKMDALFDRVFGPEESYEEDDFEWYTANGWGIDRFFVPLTRIPPPNRN